jgi:hypothetical protein
MDPPKKVYFDPYSLLVINQDGRLRQLFVPIRMQVILGDLVLAPYQWVTVEEIQPHFQHKLIFRIGQQWFPHSIFRILISY